MLNSKLISLQKTHHQTLEEMEKLRNKLKETLAAKEKKEKEAEEKAKSEEAAKTDKKEDKKEEKEVEKKEKPEETAQANKKEDKKTVKPEEKVKAESEGLIIPKAVVIAPPFTIKKIEKPEEKTDIEPRTYTVKRGDSLSSISRKLYGSSKYYKLIFDANRETIPSEKALKPGQILKIPSL